MCELELELELIQSHMSQKPVLRGEVGCACVAREISVERGGMGERGCARRLVWLLIAHFWCHLISTLHPPKKSQVEIYHPNDTQPRCTEQSATNAPLRSTGTPGAPCCKNKNTKGKWGGNEWAWVMNIAPTAAAVWAERTSEIAANGAGQNAGAVLWARFCRTRMANLRRPC